MNTISAENRKLNPTKALAACFVAGLVISAAALPAAAATLTFDGNICNGGNACVPTNPNTAFIDQTYGDISGQLDVIYDGSTNTSGLQSFKFWNTGYSGLTNIAYGASGPTAEIFLKPEAGFQVTLVGFDLGAWNKNRSSEVTVLAGAGNSLFSTGPITVSSSSPFHFSPGLTSADGFRIQFGSDTFNVAIDNIEFRVDALPAITAVPVPAALPLLLSGLVGLGLISRRRAA